MNTNIGIDDLNVFFLPTSMTNEIINVKFQHEYVFIILDTVSTVSSCQFVLNASCRMELVLLESFQADMEPLWNSNKKQIRKKKLFNLSCWAPCPPPLPAPLLLAGRNCRYPKKIKNVETRWTRFFYIVIGPPHRKCAAR